MIAEVRSSKIEMWSITIASELTANGENGCCDDPEEENDEPRLDFAPGSVVWAKLKGFLWWPGMVDVNPNTAEFTWTVKDTLGFVQKLRQNRYAKALEKAKERAEAAMKMRMKDRLKAYSFVNSYKRRCPEASNTGECSNAENGSQNVQDLLPKNPAELGSCTSTNTDGEAKGIERKINGKLTQREQKNIEKPTQKDVIDLVSTDSEQEIDGNLSRPKENDSKTIPDSEQQIDETLSRPKENDSKTIPDSDRGTTLNLFLCHKIPRPMGKD